MCHGEHPYYAPTRRGGGLRRVGLEVVVLQAEAGWWSVSARDHSGLSGLLPSNPARPNKHSAVSNPTTGHPPRT